MYYMCIVSAVNNLLENIIKKKRRKMMKQDISQGIVVVCLPKPAELSVACCLKPDFVQDTK